MRRTLIIALGAVAALMTAAAAVAALAASGVSATTATFSTDKATDVRTRTCTGADGKEFKITNGRYTGQADFANPATDLDGPLTINARTVVGTADDLGYVTGSFRIKDDDTRFAGAFTGTLKGDKLVGFLAGVSRGNKATVLGNLSATLVPGTGFSGGAARLEQLDLGARDRRRARLQGSPGGVETGAEAEAGEAEACPARLVPGGGLGSRERCRRKHDHRHVEGAVDGNVHPRRDVPVDGGLPGRDQGPDGVREGRHHLDTAQADQAADQGVGLGQGRSGRAPTGALPRFGG